MFFKREKKSDHAEDVPPPTAIENEKPPDGVQPKDGKPGVDGGDDSQYPKGLSLALILMSIFIGMFLVSLVRPPSTPFHQQEVAPSRRRRRRKVHNSS